jgi:signal transduction histidine kinase
MFLSKKWIFILIALTGISFMILLFIQFGWMQKSLELNRQQFDLNIRENSIKLRQSFLSDKVFQKAYLAEPGERNDFIAASNTSELGHAIKQKTDSILRKLGSPLSAAIYTRTGTYCYLMDYVPPGEHNTDIDHSQYKLCLCNNNCPLRLDIGFNVVTTGKQQSKGSSALVLPSVVLIFLLIALFAYAIYIINQQKKLAVLKNDFINNLTHEFNTPLFSIGITSNLLLRSEPVQQSAKLKDYVEMINTEKNRIQTQVDKILQLTALESGAVIMEKENVDMHDLIKSSMQSFENIVAEKGGTMTLTASATHATVNGDKLHLINVINNLLDNACKYSDQPPAITISTQNSNGDLVIRIADKGIGISSAEKKMIFHKFYRVKQGDRHDVKGFGLGLSYVKKIIEMHKGTVDVETGIDKGAVFIIRLSYYSN